MTVYFFIFYLMTEQRCYRLYYNFPNCCRCCCYCNFPNFCCYCWKAPNNLKKAPVESNCYWSEVEVWIDRRIFAVVVGFAVEKSFCFALVVDL